MRDNQKVGNTATMYYFRHYFSVLFFSKHAKSIQTINNRSFGWKGLFYITTCIWKSWFREVCAYWHAFLDSLYTQQFFINSHDYSRCYIAARLLEDDMGESLKHEAFNQWDYDLEVVDGSLLVKHKNIQSSQKWNQMTHIWIFFFWKPIKVVPEGCCKVSR